ncbi:hypothetical protein GALMADRAFT_239626 [Galerina marginata CBS 339.88]|uniref:Uncharacterized protein n=1 Tax=Galerina marginata (strain CBS 339.88) TaxID=685588 RepID=A0A067TEE4_GALM3|nr:hypothetical protein GALMADRAFT_239626 [Galerina marginata CBS 339.88]
MGRSAYDFDTYATRDLRTYLRRFELPKPPPCDQLDMFHLPTTTIYSKSHENNRLGLRLGKWKKLENMYSIMVENNSITGWLNRNIPVKPSFQTDSRTDVRYCLPEKLGSLYSHKPSEMSAVLSWLHLPLVTATRVLHSTALGIQHWQFIPAPADDNSLFRYIRWQPPFERGSLVVAYQTPFTLNEQDLREFIECTSFPDFDMVTNNKLEAKYRLWAKIWDACNHSCNHAERKWFVVTTYTHWVFGAFSAGGTVAFVSPILQYSNASPTILEWITYWVASSMAIPGAFALPQVDEPIPTEDVDMEPPVGLGPFYVPRAPRSESAWPGKHHEPGESAGVDLESVLSDEGSLKSVFGDGHQIVIDTSDIQKWLSKCTTAVHHRLDEDDLFAPAIPEFEFPENSHFDPGAYRGEWMHCS